MKNNKITQKSTPLSKENLIPIDNERELISNKESNHISLRKEKLEEILLTKRCHKIQNIDEDEILKINPDNLLLDGIDIKFMNSTFLHSVLKYT